MRISINEDYLRRRPNMLRRSHEETLKLLKEGGFDTADFGMFGLFHPEPREEENPILFAEQMRAYCDSIGIRINQTHAPFYEGIPMPDGYVERLKRCVEKSAILGADCVVVHADTWYEPKYIQWHYPTVVSTVYEVFAPVVELAEKKGIKIAMESLYEVQGSLYHRTRLCSLVEELDDIVGRFQCDSVGVCWDFGHANMAYGAEQFQAMKRLKSPIIATHVHDNIAKYDNHNLPFQGNIDWEEGMCTLAELGYEGDLTLEVGYGGIPDSLILDFINYAHKTGESLVSMFECGGCKHV